MHWLTSQYRRRELESDTDEVWGGGEKERESMRERKRERIGAKAQKAVC